MHDRAGDSSGDRQADLRWNAEEELEEAAKSSAELSSALAAALIMQIDLTGLSSCLGLPTGLTEHLLALILDSDAGSLPNPV